MTLLEDGEKAYREIISCIRSAKKEIYLNVFLWRDDAVGNLMAGELLAAAERGVKIGIRKDRYGVMGELSEEDRSSFFPYQLTRKEKIKITLLILLYNPGLFLMKYKETGRLSLKKLLAHPKVNVSVRPYGDHSKFYLIDRKILIFGGMNIENKSYAHDRFGRRWHDFMVKIEDIDIAERFLRKWRGLHFSGEDIFSMNRKGRIKRFDMKETYLKLIREAGEELTIIMAYFSPMPDILEALHDAVRCGVRIRILMPERANYLNHANRKTMNILRSFSKEGVLFLYRAEEMVHTKLLMNEHEFSLGSCNLTAGSFNWLGELNLIHPNGDDDFSRSVRAAVERAFRSAKRVRTGDLMIYDPLWALVETGMI